MLYPPSLSEKILSRAFRAGNGELGLELDDAFGFLDTCEADGVTVHGWELWIVDHQPSDDFKQPEPAAGQWWGGIPMLGSPHPNIIHGDGDLAEIRSQVENLDKDLAQIDPRWAPHVRINFTLD
jgi:hypothetical protein